MHVVHQLTLEKPPTITQSVRKRVQFRTHQFISGHATHIIRRADPHIARAFTGGITELVVVRLPCIEVKVPSISGRSSAIVKLICEKALMAYLVCGRTRKVFSWRFVKILTRTYMEAVRKIGFTIASILAAISSAGMRSGVWYHRRAAPKIAQAAVAANSAESTPGAAS